MVDSPWGPLPGWLVYPLVVTLGLAVGSFANVLIYRLPREESIVTPPSRCPSCGRGIRWYENIPVLGFLFLRGKCAGCGSGISIQYPLVEAASGILAWLGVHQFGVTYAGFAYSLLFIALLALVIIDLQTWLLPFAITIPMAIVGLIGAIFFDMIPIRDALIGMVVGAAIFLILLYGGRAVFKKDAMGGGDVVFGIMAGAFLGWKLTILMIFVASFLGTFIALAMLALGKDISGRMIPFGPFLAAAMVICLLWGNSLLNWYFRLIGV